MRCQRLSRTRTPIHQSSILQPARYSHPGHWSRELALVSASQLAPSMQLAMASSLAQVCPAAGSSQSAVHWASVVTSAPSHEASFWHTRAHGEGPQAARPSAATARAVIRERMRATLAQWLAQR